MDGDRMTCEDGAIFPTGDHEPIDHGVVIYLKCSACERVFEAAIDIDEMKEVTR